MGQIKSMCRPRASADAIRPGHGAHPRPSRSSYDSSSSNPQSSSSSSATASLNFNIFNFSSNSSSRSAHQSLSKIKQFLPDTPLIYTLSDLRLATNNFHSGRLSSSSSSWRCALRGREAVVFQRRLRRPLDLPQLSRRLSAITKSHHSILIKLLGASVSGNFIYLVYEFVPGASLSDCLRNRVNRAFTVLSSWLSRMQIAAELAHGLDYIHHCAGSSIGGGGAGFVHNHIKSSSIIVTEPSLNARICHFGTAELCGEAAEEEEEEEESASEPGGSRKLKRTSSRGVKLAGTRGYMSPEYLVTGVATQKSDVFAFGVVLLELLSGEEALRYCFNGEDGGGGYQRMSVIESAREAVEGGRVRSWVDGRLKDSYPVEVAERMVSLGLECVEEAAARRPDMSQVSAVISKLYLESKAWAEKFGLPVDFSVSMAPR